MLVRAIIIAPETDNPDHAHHGRKVLAPAVSRNRYARVYFTEGEEVTGVVRWASLKLGWELPVLDEPKLIPDLIIRPLLAFKTAGYPGHTLDPKRHYPAIHALNQPDWAGKGLVFVAFDGSHPLAGTADTLMLDEGDYEIVTPAVTAV